jgi:hypothetical protein
MDNTTITPALSADEWEEVRVERSAAIAGQMAHRSVNIYDARAAARHMALANAALPDGHPLKITGKMVENIRDVAGYLRVTLGSGANFWQREDEPTIRAFVNSAIRHADALAALLPPEGS